MPGAGKSVLASVVIDHLSQTVVDENHALAFVYCNYKERAQQTQNSLISSLINQLIASTGDFPSDLGPLYHRHSLKGTKPSQSELLSLLTSIASRFEYLFLVIDALDEYDDSEGIRDALIPTLYTAVPNACILVTSRPYVKPQSSDVSRLYIRASDHDIRRYLRNQILRQPRLKRHTQADPSLSALIEDNRQEVRWHVSRLYFLLLKIRTQPRHSFLSKNDSSRLSSWRLLLAALLGSLVFRFLLTQLHIGALATKNTRTALRSAIQVLPTELDTTYDDALHRINDQNSEDASLAKNILMWVFVAPNPLTVRELQHAIGTMALVDEPDLDDDDLPDSDVIIAVCAGLVVADKESNLVRLVHYTIQKYFDSNPVFPLPSAQRIMSETCLTYLSLAPLREGPCKNNVKLRDRFERYTFLRYAALNWGFHAQGDTEKICGNQILKFLSEDELRASALQASQVTTYYPAMEMYKFWSAAYPKSRSGFAMTATFGLTSIVQCLTETTEDIDVGDYENTTALMCAARAGHTSTLEVLLDAGVSIEKADVSGGTALIAAAFNNHIEAVKLLLAKGANIDAETVYKRTSLHTAMWRGHQMTVMLLLENGANVKAGHDLMQVAVWGGHTNMIELASGLIGQTHNNDEIKSSLLDRIHYNRPSTTNIEVLIKKGASLT
ncbi:MAG: hypothetical protein Q9203_004520 [Teloschistes exilis]